MTWADWSDNPVMDWMEEDLPNATLQKGLVILVDYEGLAICDDSARLVPTRWGTRRFR